MSIDVLRLLVDKKLWVGLGISVVMAAMAACTPTPVATPSATAPSAPMDTPTLAPAETQPAATGIVEPTSTAAPTAVPDATDFPDPNGFEWQEWLGGLNKPVDLLAAGDGSGRVFILEQAGLVRLVLDGQLQAQPFLDLRARVGSEGNEQGLLGMAFAPDFPTSQAFYVDYTDKAGDTVVSRFHVSADPNLADPASEQILVQVVQPYANHNGGGLSFGPDGYLYISLGDGGSAGDPQGNAQSTATLLGKILRIDVSPAQGYAIPADNPFASGGGRQEIWLYGLRNPWRFSFDRLTGDLYIADVGQNQWEEIDFLLGSSPGGVNYGWNYREGFHPYAGQPPAGMALSDPIFEYDHSQGCSVTGGFVYRGQALPEWQGIYLFGDYCRGNVWGLLRQGGAWQARLLYETPYNISSFGTDDSGEIYLLEHRTGTVYKLVRR